MKQALQHTVRVAGLTLAGTLGAIVAGLCVYGSSVFDPTSPGFSFVSFGLSGALIFAFCHVRGVSESITAAAVVSAVQFAAVSQFIMTLRAAIFSFGLNFPVIALAFIFERKLAAHARWKFLVVGLTYGAMSVLLTLVVGIVAGAEGLPAQVFRDNLLDGLLLGTGLGLGIQGGEAMAHSLAEHASASGKK
jgi:thiamine transporter ThiT